MTKDEGDRSSQSAAALGVGLTSEEAMRRINEYGYNEVTERKTSKVVMFFKKFWGLSPWMLEMTIALEWLVGKYLEMYIVIGLLFFNAILSFLQEEKANSALELLRQRLRINARVKRDGKWDINGLIKAGAFLGILMVVESFLLLYMGFSYFGLYDNIDQLHTFVFNWLTFSGYFTVRERKHFWEYSPSRALTLSIAINMMIVSLISIVGIPGLAPISPTKLLTVLAYSFVTCLLLNDLIKAFLVRRFGMEL